MDSDGPLVEIVHELSCQSKKLEMAIWIWSLPCGPWASAISGYPMLSVSATLSRVVVKC